MKSRLSSDYLEKKKQNNNNNNKKTKQMAPAEMNFQLSSFLSLRRHLFIHRLSFLLKITRFIRVLSKMEYILIIQNARSKMADVFSALFRNKWRHHDITADVKNHLCVSQLPFFIRDLTSCAFFALTLLWGKFGFYQYIQQYDVIMTTDYVTVSI